MSKTRKNKVTWIERAFLSPYLAFCPTEKVWHKMLKKLDLPDFEYVESASGQCAWIENKETNQDYIIVTIPNTKFDKTYKTSKDARQAIDGLIVHEVTHAFDYICKIINEKKPSKEFKACCTQYLFIMMQDAYERSLK